MGTMRGNVVDSHCPATYIGVCKSSVTGDHKVLTTFGLVPSVARHVKGSEENLNQRINYYASNAGTDGDSLRGRWADHQCHNRGSEVIVVVEVTLHQGDGSTEHRAKDLRLDHPCKIKYVRYADDALILIAGTREEAEIVRDQIKEKLSEMGLRLSEEKTKITHWSQKVRFLGYQIHGELRDKGVGIRAVLSI